MKFLAIIDQFITKEVVDEALLPLFGHLPNFSISYISSDWPITPLQNGDEVREFVGDEEELAKVVGDVDIIVNHVGPITKRVLDAAKQLKLIAVMRGGPININVEEATKRSIPVVNAPGRNGPVVAEFTIGMILAAVHNIAQAHADMRNKNWRGDFYVYEKSGFELDGKRAGLIGFGAIGSLVATILKAFGMEVVVYDPFVKEEDVKSAGASLATLDELLTTSDIVSLHARVTKETTGMIGEAEFAKMKKGAAFINSARGPLVDYDALTDALASGHLGSAALDTFYEEPLPEESKLYELPNVVLTPHIGGSSKETAKRAAALVAEDIQRFIANEKMARCLNPEALTS